MAPHDFLDEEWTQTDEAPPPGRSRRTRTPPRGGRGRLGGVVFALGIVVILAATGVALWTPREVTPTPVEVAAPTEADPAAEGPEQPTTTTEAADAPPDAAPAVEQIIARWATRESAEDESWSDQLAGQIAPDTARRLAVQSCLPVQSAPLRVDAITSDGEPTQEGGTWSGDLTVTVTDDAGAQTPVTVRAQAAWNEPTTTWMLTGLECLSSGGPL